MSLVQKLLPHRSGYTLDVTDVKLAGGAKQLRLAPYGAAGKRMMAILLAFAFIALTSISGLFMTTAASPKASANWISDIFCTPLGNGDLSNDMDNKYGGINGVGGGGNVAWVFGRSVALGGASGLAGAGATGGILDIRQDPKADKKTAYEAFTPFLPVFDAYVGYYVDPNDDNNPITFKYPTSVKNGKPGSTVYETQYTGDPYEVGQSYLFSHDVGTDCLAGAAGKSFAINVSNSMFMIPKLVTFFSAEVYGWAIQNAAISEDGSALHGLLYGDDTGKGGLNEIITGSGTAKGLKDVLYLPFLLPIVMLSALYIAYQALVKRQTSSATGSIIWLVAASITGVLFLSNPQVVPEIADNIVTSVNSATTKAINGSGSSIALCNLSDNPSTNQLAREVKCEIWYNTIYVPWVSGQFGVGTKITGGNDVLTQSAGFTTTGSGASANNQILDSMTIKMGGKTVKNNTTAAPDSDARWQVNWGTYELQQQIANVNGTKANQFSALAFSQLSANKGAILNQTWGGDPLRQFNAALLAAIASIGTLILVLSTGFLLIGYQISVIFLLMLSPFFFLIGAIPGMGRSIMMRWFELIVGTIIKRILLTFVLAIFLRLYAMVMELPNIDWWLKVVLLIILSVVAMSQRSNLINAFTKIIDFGGNKNIGDGTDGARTLGKRLATGAALAGMSAVGARAGFGNIPGVGKGGTGSKLRNAAGAISNLRNGGKGGAVGSGAGAGGVGGGDGGVNGDGANGIDPTTGGTDINGIPTGDTRAETDKPRVITRELPPMISGEEYKAQIVVYGNPQPTISVTGFPSGLTVNASDGKITGTPSFDTRGEKVIKLRVTIKATNTHGDDNAEFEIEGFTHPQDVLGGDTSRQARDIRKAQADYNQNQLALGSDTSRASDVAADAAYKRAELNAKDAGKPNKVKAKHSPEAYRAAMEAEIGKRPEKSQFVGENGRLDRNAYELALEDYNAKAEGYKATKPYGEFAKDSLEERAKRKADITGEIDPDDRKRLEARAKAMRQAAMNGIQRGFVDNKNGDIGFNRGELFNAYRGAYQLGDTKSTNAEIKLDAARDRQEAAESRAMLQRQIELQEAGLRLQGWNPDNNDGTLPPAPTGGPTPLPPTGGNGPRPTGGTGGAAPTAGPRPVAPATGGAAPVPPISSAPVDRSTSAPTAQMSSPQIPQAPSAVDAAPAFIVGPPNPVTPATPVAPAAVPATPAQREALRQEILRGRQQNAEQRAQQTGGPVQPVAAPTKPSNTTRRVTVNPAQQAPVVSPPTQVSQSAPISRKTIVTSGDNSVNATITSAEELAQAQADSRELLRSIDRNQTILESRPGDTSLMATIRHDSNARKELTEAIRQAEPLFVAPAAPVAPAPDLTEVVEQNEYISQAMSTPAPAPVAPRRTASPQRQQQTQQQLRTTSAAPAAPKKPVTGPIPAAPKPQQAPQQQVVSAPANPPKKPAKPVKLPPIKVTVNNNAPVEPQQAQSVIDPNVTQPAEQQSEAFQQEQTLQAETKFLNTFSRETQSYEAEYARIKRLLDDGAAAQRAGRGGARLADAWQQAQRFNQLRVSSQQGRVRRYNDMVDNDARIDPNLFRGFDRRDY